MKASLRGQVVGMALSGATLATIAAATGETPYRCREVLRRNGIRAKPEPSGAAARRDEQRNELERSPRPKDVSGQGAGIREAGLPCRREDPADRQRQQKRDTDSPQQVTQRCPEGEAFVGGSAAQCAGETVSERRDDQDVTAGETAPSHVGGEPGPSNPLSDAGRARPTDVRSADARNVEILRRYRAGDSYGAIQKALGVTRSAAAGIVARARSRGELDGVPLRDTAGLAAANDARRQLLAAPVAAPPPAEPERAPRGCQWIAGEPTGEDGCKCGAPVARPGEAWCERHRALVYERKLRPIDVNWVLGAARGRRGHG